MAPPRKVTDDELRAALLASNTCDEAAAALGISRSTVMRRIGAMPELRKSRGDVHRKVTDEELRAAIAGARSVSAAARNLGLHPVYLLKRVAGMPDAAAVTAHMSRTPALRAAYPDRSGAAPIAARRGRIARGKRTRAAVLAAYERTGSINATSREVRRSRQRVSQILQHQESTTMTTVTLSTLDPISVGEAAACALVEHIARAAFRLSPGVALDLRPTDPAALRSTDLALTVAALTTYAQRGGAVWDWTGDEDAADALTEVCAVLATPAVGDRGTVPDLLLGHAEGADDPVRLVLTAAWARVCLSRGDAVTAPQIGALAGLSASRVRALRGAGEIPGWEAGTGRGAEGCPAGVARRWLAARGVVGV